MLAPAGTTVAVAVASPLSPAAALIAAMAAGGKGRLLELMRSNPSLVPQALAAVEGLQQRRQARTAYKKMLRAPVCC